VELIVVLFHGGGECADFKNPSDLSSCDLDDEVFQLVRQLPPSLVDIVFGGHKHKGVAHFVGKTAVAQAYWAGEAFSRVDVTFDRSQRQGKVDPATHIYEPQPLCPRGHVEPCQALAPDGTVLPPVESVKRRAGEWVSGVQLFSDQRLGARCEGTLRRSSDAESALGNLFADLMRGAVSGADVALANAGSIRADLPEGQLTFGDVYEAMPFDNQLATARLSVAELRQLLQRHATHQEHGPLALSGIRAAARCEHGEVIVRLWHPNGAELSDDQVLGVVTSDFIASGGDELLPPALHPRFHVLSEAPVRQALIQGLQQRGAVGSTDKELHDPSRPRLWLDGDLSRCGISAKPETPNGTQSPPAP
jgi:5'-nucleotidase